MITITKDYLPIFAKFFSRSIIEELLYKKEPKYIIQSLKHSKCAERDDLLKLKFRDMFNLIYKQLVANYRCEYIYKNEILFHEILSDKHSQKATLLTELNVGKSKADLVVINGTTTVYEIKTELDSTARLEGQLSDYIQVFDRVNVITCESKVKNIEKIINSDSRFQNVGIYLLLTQPHTRELNVFKESFSSIEFLDKSKMFSTLNYSEIRKHLPGYTKEYFLSLPNIEAHKIFLSTMKKRVKDDLFVGSMPESLKMIGTSFHNLSRKHKNKLVQKLDNCIFI